MTQATETAFAVVKLDPYQSVPEAAKLLRVSQMALYKLIADGELVSFKTGSRRLVDTKSILAYVEKCRRARQQRDPRVDAMLAARQAKRAEKKAANMSRPKLVARSHS